jgi:hypothetical protein
MSITITQHNIDRVLMRQHYLEFDPNALGKVRELLDFPETWAVSHDRAT